MMGNLSQSSINSTANSWYLHPQTILGPSHTTSAIETSGPSPPANTPEWIFSEAQKGEFQWIFRDKFYAFPGLYRGWCWKFPISKIKKDVEWCWCWKFPIIQVGNNFWVWLLANFIKAWSEALGAPRCWNPKFDGSPNKRRSEIEALVSRCRWCSLNSHCWNPTCFLVTALCLTAQR